MKYLTQVLGRNRRLKTLQSVSLCVIGLHLDERDRLLVGVRAVDETDNKAAPAVAVFAMDLAAEKVECLYDAPRVASAYRYDPSRQAHVLLLSGGIVEVIGKKATITKVAGELSALGLVQGGAVVGAEDGTLSTVKAGVVKRLAIPKGVDEWRIEAIVAAADEIFVVNTGGEVIGGKPSALKLLCESGASSLEQGFAILRRAGKKLLVGGSEGNNIAAYLFDGKRAADLAGVPYNGVIQALALHDGKIISASYNSIDRIRLLACPATGDKLTKWYDAPITERTDIPIQIHALRDRLVVAHGASIHILEGATWSRIACTYDVAAPFKRGAGVMMPSKS